LGVAFFWFNYGRRRLWDSNEVVVAADEFVLHRGQLALLLLVVEDVVGGRLFSVPMLLHKRA